MDTGWVWPVFCLPALSPETLSPWLIGAGSPLGVQRGWESRFLQTQPPSAHRGRARAVEVNLGLERDRSVWSGSRGRGATSLKSGGPEAADASPPPPPPSSSRSSTDRARPTTSGGHPLSHGKHPHGNVWLGVGPKPGRHGLACLTHKVHSRWLRTGPRDSPAAFGVLCEVWASPSPPPSRGSPPQHPTSP